MVWGSDANEEHQELLSKTRILHQVIAAEGFELFETNLVETTRRYEQIGILVRYSKALDNLANGVSPQQFANAANEALRMP